ncbi:TPA: DUF2770 family protein, partial [Salmonella enterica subsp. enterica serovar Paratyphi C]|nr:DUF2770 family protein [Salmonella enterica subsp. enterica serovar Paratyphi C]
MRRLFHFLMNNIRE